MKRARLVQVVVNLVVVADDGEWLDPLQIEPIVIPPRLFASFNLADTMAELQSKLDGPIVSTT